MSDKPVTVCITNYNGAKYLPWCLEAVQKLDPQPAELIVVDNASTDHSVQLLKERYPEVKRVILPVNEGPCPARNRGLEEAAHPLVFQLDCDVAPHPESLKILLQNLEQGGPQVVACQPRAVFEDRPDLIHYDSASFHYVGQLRLSHYYASLWEAPCEAGEVDAVISMALLLRKKEVLDNGGYDPNFFILFEDHDLSFRLRSRGFKLISVPEAIVVHREGTAGVSFRKSSRYPKRRAFLQSRNRWIVLAKNHRIRTLILSGPGLILFELAWFFFSLREGFLLDFIKGKLSFLRLLPRVLTERKKVQALRVLRDRDLLNACDLTFSPLISKSSLEAFLERSMNRLLRFWWRLVFPLIG